MRTPLLPVLIACLAPTTFAAARERPNVLLILTDDQGYGDLGLHGNPHLKTPNLDRLGSTAIRFDRFYVSPLCAPTRASILTGRYALRTGVKGVSRGAETMPAEEVTLAESLRGAGYRTAYFGKWHNGEHYPYTPLGQGFDRSFGFQLGHWNNYFDTTLDRDGRPEKTRGYINDVLTDEVLRFLDEPGDAPFLAYLAYNTPHSPFQVPDAYFDRYKALGLDDRLACIYGMCANLDDNIGRMLGRLEDRGLRENTIVVFLTDNGPNGARFNAGMRGTKGSLHEGGSRVPCFLSWPARYREPRTVDRIAAHIDLLPTLLELCGVPCPTTFPLDGRSLVPLLDGDAADWPDRILFGQHQLPAPGRPLTGSLRTQQHRLVNEGRGWQLFDMEADPGQTRDIATEEPDRTRALVAAYEAWWAEIRTQADRPIPPIPVGHPRADTVVLPTPQARFDGGIRFSGKHPNNAWLTGWESTDATVAWDLEVARPGRYRVSLEYLCPPEDAGGRVEARSGDRSIRIVVAPTAVRQVPSPDRFPRDEVYEMEWARQVVGVIDLEQGRQTLTLRALERPGRQVLELKSLILDRLEGDGD